MCLHHVCMYKLNFQTILLTYWNAVRAATKFSDATWTSLIIRSRGFGLTVIATSKLRHLTACLFSSPFSFRPFSFCNYIYIFTTKFIRYELILVLTDLNFVPVCRQPSKAGPFASVTLSWQQWYLNKSIKSYNKRLLNLKCFNFFCRLHFRLLYIYSYIFDFDVLQKKIFG